MFVPPKRVSSIAALTDAAGLSGVLGWDVDNVRVEPLRAVGYSNSTHVRVEAAARRGESRGLVLKRWRLDEDWTARRSGDRRGREGMFLGEPALRAVWDSFACPYVAWAVGPGELGLLLDDLTDDLLPDAREPLSEAQESALLGALTNLHARFWESPLEAIDWLVRPSQFCDLLAPSILADPTALAVLSPAIREGVTRGWPSALARLPAHVARHLTRPGIEWERAYADLPRTLLHGDAKIANFAIHADGRVAAFDWAWVGTGPCGIDLGWYLAVSASRLTCAKEEYVRRYRTMLERELGRALPDALWARMESVAIVHGARMLLWSKALALDAGRPGAQAEWGWWALRLEGLDHSP